MLSCHVMPAQQRLRAEMLASPRTHIVHICRWSSSSSIRRRLSCLYRLVAQSSLSSPKKRVSALSWSYVVGTLPYPSTLEASQAAVRCCPCQLAATRQRQPHVSARPINNYLWIASHTRERLWDPHYSPLRARGCGRGQRTFAILISTLVKRSAETAFHLPTCVRHPPGSTKARHNILGDSSSETL